MDCNLDFFKYKDLRDEGWAVVEANFTASLDLYTYRTATGQAMTHTVIEPFFLHKNVREEGGITTCMKISHIHIGGCEGKGKHNDW